MAGLDRGDGLVAGCSWDHVAFGVDGAEGDAAEADAPGISVAVVRATVVRTRPKARPGPTLVADVLVACLAAAASRSCWLTFNSLDWGCRSRAASNRPVYSIRVDRRVSGGIFSTPPDLLPTAAYSGRDQAGPECFSHTDHIAVTVGFIRTWYEIGAPLAARRTRGQFRSRRRIARVPRHAPRLGGRTVPSRRAVRRSYRLTRYPYLVSGRWYSGSTARGSAQTPQARRRYLGTDRAA